MLTLTCQRCEHEWEYAGESQYYTTCPDCKTSVKVEEGSSQPGGTSETSEEMPSTVELATGDMVREVEIGEAIEELHERENALGEAQEQLRQRVVEIEEQIGDRREEIEEVAAILQELIEGMGGQVDYKAVGLDSDGVEAITGVQEAAKEVEVDG